jgi:hypothetical protein
LAIDRLPPELAWADMVLADYSKTPAECRAYQTASAVAEMRINQIGTLLKFKQQTHVPSGRKILEIS